MTQDNPYFVWPEDDDKVVVNEMLQDSTSIHWRKCQEFVKRRVPTLAKNIPSDQWDDIVQDTMLRIHKSLPTFKFECKLKNWLYKPLRSSIVDAHRRLTRSGQPEAYLVESPEDLDYGGEDSAARHLLSVEDEFMIRDELEQAFAALLEYVDTHANSLRNGHILNMVIFEGRSLEEASRIIGCSAPVVGYVVRSAQRYTRKKLCPNS